MSNNIRWLVDSDDLYNLIQGTYIKLVTLQYCLILMNERNKLALIDTISFY